MDAEPGAAPLPFLELAPGLGAGAPAPPGWKAIGACPLLVLVGVTGVGKSTTLERLLAGGPACSLLPDRRVLTDALIIPAMQQDAGLSPGPVADRKLRFELTRRYRARFPGGMAHALAQLCLDPALWPGLLVFDGLRGANEIAHAAAALPRACFAMLDAPDAVRVRRLLGRNDAFDRIAGNAPNRKDSPSLPEGIFTVEEEAALLGLVAAGAVSADDLRAKVQIVAEERKNYSPAETRAALLAHAGERALIVDTTRHAPPDVAAQIAAQARAWGLL